jgi:hypothetical protein
VSVQDAGEAACICAAAMTRCRSNRQSGVERVLASRGVAACFGEVLLLYPEGLDNH